jgi:formyl-CoA transferase
MFQSADGVWITVTSGTPRSVRNVAEMLGEPLEKYETPEAPTNASHLNSLLKQWIADRTADECLQEMHRCDVVASPILDAAAICADPLYEERGDIIEILDPDLGPVRMQGVIPRLRNHAGAVWRAGASLGEDNQLVYGKYLGMTSEAVALLKNDGVI